MNPNFEIVTDDNLIENLLFDNSNIGIKNSKRRKTKKWRLKSIEKVIEDFLLNNLESCYVICTLLPLIALFIDTIYPITTNYSAVIGIRCESHLIENFWPALSQTIGYSYLTQYIWLIFIVSHTPLRLLGAHYLRASYNTLTDKPILRFIIKLAYVVNIFEIISLCLLAISMLYFFDYHKYVVMMFLLSFLAFLQINLFIEYQLKSKDPVFYVKLIIGLVYVVCLLTILVTFLYMCEPNVFSIFGIAEIVLVVSNVLFHTMSYFSIKELLRMEKTSEIVEFC